MRSLLTLTATALVLSTLPAEAQTPPPPADPAVLNAYLAWDRGDYPDALRGYLDVLSGSDGESFRREIAHLTGEVYRVLEVAEDGGNLAMSPSGSFMTFEVVEGNETVTKLVDTSTGEVVKTVAGTSAAPSDAGAVAYMVVDVTPDVVAARQATANAQDRQERFAARAELERVTALATEVRVEEPSGATWTPETDTPGYPAALHWLPSGELLTSFGTRPAAATTTVGYRDGELTRIVVSHTNPGSVQIGNNGEIVVEGASQLSYGPRTHTEQLGVSFPSLSTDGSTLSFLASGPDGESSIQVVALTDPPSEPQTVHSSTRELRGLATSPDGAWVAYQDRVVHDWEIFVVRTDGSGVPVQLSEEIQHDQFPTWIDDERLIAAKGEGRHRRSFVYSVNGGEPLKLFHNNSIRTIAPEYEWVAAPGSGKVGIVSERDGDTVSPERGVYLVDLTTELTRAQVAERLETMLAAEQDLRARGEAAYAPIATEVRRITEQIDVGRIYLAARDLYEMGSKFITQPGNRLALRYLEAQLREYGYEPELQWFEPRPGIQTANVIARLEGTRDPQLVYAVSSHFDSVERGPGTDDNSSGTTALLEAARVMVDQPQPTTIEFAFFTGEEAGLLGSREYVRRAVAEGKQIIGALNNDMVGFANDHRLDNTIRYSNPGIRDIQHAAAMQFSDLITYDALYYKSTDAAAYYEAYGDIVGGIGSYPVLGNPHYHQFTDRLETINQHLVQAVSQTTAATLMLLTRAPARLKNLVATSGADGVEASWDPAPESNVASYEVLWESPDGIKRTMTVDAPPSGSDRVTATLPAVPSGTHLLVRALNASGMHGWDWAIAELTGG